MCAFEEDRLMSSTEMREEKDEDKDFFVVSVERQNPINAIYRDLNESSDSEMDEKRSWKRERRASNDNEMSGENRNNNENVKSNNDDDSSNNKNNDNDHIRHEEDDLASIYCESDGENEEKRSWLVDRSSNTSETMEQVEEESQNANTHDQDVNALSDIREVEENVSCNENERSSSSSSDDEISTDNEEDDRHSNDFIEDDEISIGCSDIDECDGSIQNEDETKTDNNANDIVNIDCKNNPRVGNGNKKHNVDEDERSQNDDKNKSNNGNSICYNSDSSSSEEEENDIKCDISEWGLENGIGQVHTAYGDRRLNYRERKAFLHLMTENFDKTESEVAQIFFQKFFKHWEFKTLSDYRNNEFFVGNRRRELFFACLQKRFSHLRLMEAGDEVLSTAASKALDQSRKSIINSVAKMVNDRKGSRKNSLSKWFTECPEKFVCHCKRRHLELIGALCLTCYRYFCLQHGTRHERRKHKMIVVPVKQKRFRSEDFVKQE